MPILRSPAAPLLLLAGCTSAVEPIREGGLDLSVCDPAHGPFSTVINNAFLPLPVGKVSTLEGSEDGAKVKLVITVLDRTETVAGVATRVVEERETQDGELVEVSRNFFVQAQNGTVCYYGEEVDIFEGGKIAGHEGQWRAGENGSRPGIMMPPTPAVGMFFSQEVAPGTAEDRAEIVAVGETAKVPAGTFPDAMRTREWTPLEPKVSESKVYAPGVGLVIDGPLQLTSR